MGYCALSFTKVTLRDGKAKLQQKKHRGSGLLGNLFPFGVILVFGLLVEIWEAEGDKLLKRPCREGNL